MFSSSVQQPKFEGQSAGRSTITSLPTPPSTSRRDKENAPLRRRKIVEWADSDQIHWISKSGVRDEYPSQAASTSHREPLRPILKPPRPLPLMSWFDEEEKKRDMTPQPEDVLSNAGYLHWPVSQILSSSEEGSTLSLRELTEAYSVLAFRVRTSLLGSDNRSNATGDSEPPVFLQPLRSNAEELTNAIVRDLGRVLSDPLSPSSLYTPSMFDDTEFKSNGLPSPQGSPKKRGLSEEEVKQARDVCTVCHAVIKFLAVAFLMPVVSNVFSAAQLHAILTQLLTIPLAPTLPTPNARKTYALAIGLLQAQRLPVEVLSPVRDDIVIAIQRGIEGQLGKEGKKGAGGDGLKAIHDLSLRFPEVFVPAFANILPSIFENLISPAPAMRSNAAHALGGFVVGLTSTYLTLDFALVEHISDEAFAFLTPSSPSQNSTPSTPLSPLRSSDAQILRFLRATLKNPEPTCASQSPVWALSVLSSFIVLLGPALVTDMKAFKMMEALLLTAVRHKKGAIRILASTAWRPFIWVWSKWRFLDHLSYGPLDDGALAAKNEVLVVMEKFMKSTLDCRVGISIIGARLGSGGELCSEDDMHQALEILQMMANSGGSTAASAIHLLNHLLSGIVETRADAEPYCMTIMESGGQSPFDAKLIPRSLFSVSPGLLTIDWKVLNGPVKGVLEECPNVYDVRRLLPEELANPAVWLDLMAVWQDSIASLELDAHENTPPPIIDGWMSLVTARVAVIQNVEDAVDFGKRCADVLIGILTNKEVNFGSTTATPSSSITPPGQSAGSIKFSVVRDLWAHIPSSFTCPAAIRKAVNRFLSFLIKNERRLVPSSNPDSQTRCDWAMLCADVVQWGALQLSAYFWKGPKDWDWGWTPEQRSVVWRSYARSWREGEGPASWEAASIILGFPFDEENPWDMAEPDLTEWEALLQFAVAKGLSEGYSSATVLEAVSLNIRRTHLTSLSCCTQVADMLLSHLDLSSEAESELEFPSELFDLVHDIMGASYPPEPHNKIVGLWLLRSLCSVIDACPKSHLALLLETMHDGLCSWMTDESGQFTIEEYSHDIVPLYQTILVSLQVLLPTVEILQSLSSVLTAALRGQSAEGQEALEAFKDFWQTNCASFAMPQTGWAEGIAGALEELSVQYGPVVFVGHDQVDSKEQCVVPTEDVGTIQDNDLSLDTPEALPLTCRASDDPPLIFPATDDEELKLVAMELPRARPVLKPSLMTDERVPGVPPDRTPSPRSESEQDNAETVMIPPFATPSISFATPRHLKTKTPMPPRPERASNGSGISRSGALQCPSSPLIDVSIRKSRKHQRRRTSSSSSRSEEDEKENAIPSVGSVSTGSPLRTITNSPLKVLGKRNALKGSPSRSAKRRKLSDDDCNTSDMAPMLPFALYNAPDIVNEREEERLVEETLVIPCKDDSKHKDQEEPASSEIPESATPATLPVAPLRKRKGVFMDSIVLPRLDKAQRASYTDCQLSDETILDYEFTPTSSPFDETKVGKRRKVGTRSQSAVKREAEGLISLLGSDDALSSDDATPASSSSELSDDIPAGQLTPHHLITPPLRRCVVKEELKDPPSDDSLMSSSPVRSHVARNRKVQRTSSVRSVGSAKRRRPLSQ